MLQAFAALPHNRARFRRKRSSAHCEQQARYGIAQTALKERAMRPGWGSYALLRCYSDEKRGR